MSKPADWLTPSIELMRSDPRILVANPIWFANLPEHETLARETLEYRDDFALGLGFSDQVFLLRRSDVAGPIYRQRCVAMLRYPMVTVSPSFEARLDAWMRHHGRLRATYRGAEYRHPEQIGAGYPDRKLPERLRYGVNQLALAAVRASPLKRRCWLGV